MQESLSQFMYHSRSTTERHYRHHLSHRGLYSVFMELAKFQAMPEGHITNTDLFHGHNTLLSTSNSTEPIASSMEMYSQFTHINNISNKEANQTDNCDFGSSSNTLVTLPSVISFESSLPSELLTDLAHSDDNAERSDQISIYSGKRMLKV